MDTCAPPPSLSPFAHAVAVGLDERPRSLPAVWHYDALGSTLFEAICLLPEYDLTRVENMLLETHAAAVLEKVGHVSEVLELGSGVASKTIALIRAAMCQASPVCYRPIDVSIVALREAERRLNAACPGVAYAPIIGDYTNLLQQGLPLASGSRLVLFLGSNVGNYSAAAAASLLRALQQAMTPGDTFLLGTALQRPTAALLAAYDDPTGVTAAFNLNVLGRINRELGGNFNLRAFRHEVTYDEASGALDSFLVAQSEQRVDIEALNKTFVFTAGERLHTESSYKYTVAGVRALGEAAGFTWIMDWVDTESSFCDALFVC